MATPIDTDKVMAQEQADKFELLLEEMASLLDTDEDLTVDEGIPLLADGDIHDLRDDDVDLGEEFFNLRDGPIVVGAPRVDPSQGASVPGQESQEIQLVVDYPADEAGNHVVHFRMTPDQDREVLSLDFDSVDFDSVDDEDEESQPSLSRSTVRQQLGRLLSLFREDH